MASVLKALGEVCSEISQGQHRPQQKFIRDLLFGAFKESSLCLSRIAAGLDERAASGDPRRAIHTVKRLSRNLNSDRLNDGQLTAAVQAQAAQLITAAGTDLTIAVDYTDISKRWANPKSPAGQEGVCYCYDGSEGKTDLGLPVAEITARLGPGVQVPLALRVFSHKYNKAQGLSQNHVFLNEIKAVAPLVPAHAWWTFDRGFDGRAIFEGLDEIGVQWLVRLRADRKDKTIASGVRNVVLDDGTAIAVDELAGNEDLLQLHGTFSSIEHRKKAKGRMVLHWTEHIVALKVFLLDEYGKAKQGRGGRPCTLLVVSEDRFKKSRVLLASEWTEDEATHKDLVERYRHRWTVEETARQAKDSRGFGPRIEDIRALKLRGVQRLLLVSQAIQVFLAGLRRLPSLVELGAELLRTCFTVSPGSLDKSYQLFDAIKRKLWQVQRGTHLAWRRRPPP